MKLCETITQPHRERHYGQRECYTSRWKLILEEYNCVRARLLNSAALLEGTDLALFPINETTLVRWYKNTTRTNEVKLLLQGRSLPGSQLSCASDSLPPAQSRPCSLPPPPDDQLTFPEPEDTTGQAHVRQSRPAPSTAQDTSSTSTGTSSAQDPSSEPSSSSSAPGPSSSAPGPSSSAPGQTSHAPVPTPATPLLVSRTTEWRRRKQAEAAGSTSAPTTAAAPRSRKVYSCRICGQAMSKQTGHTQFKGKRYCPMESGQVSQEEWLAQLKAEAAAKGAPQKP